MLLTLPDLDLFFRLHRTLMFFVNQRLQVIPGRLNSPEAFAALPPEARLQVRDALLSQMDLIHAFVEDNPAGLSEEELAIVDSWQHLVHGRFYVFRELKKHTVLLSSGDPPVAYGVLALSQPFEELIGPHLPVLTQTVLLPFKGRIVYDGLMTSYPISFGPGIRRSLNEGYREAKARYGIVTSLPMSDRPVAPREPKPRPRVKQKNETKEVLATIISLTDQFCQEHLNDEYGELSRKLAEKLARKRPSPLLSGKPVTWASGIVRTIGGVNFLHDKSQAPHLLLRDIDAGFGISESAGSAKAAAIRKMLKIHQMDPEWTLPSRLEDNLLVWMLEVNGFIMDVRQAPREVQEIAFRQGLIPYVPADRAQE